MNLQNVTNEMLANRDSLADDGEVLRAIMAFLDEPDILLEESLLNTDAVSNNSGSSSGRSDPDPDSPRASGKSARSKTTRKAPTPRVFNRSRLRRRHEVLSLREQVIALEQRLDALQNGGETKPAIDKIVDASKLRVSAWQTVAEDQREQLTAAEHEREKLRSLIKEYKLAVKRVERFLTKHKFPTSLLDQGLVVLTTAVGDPEKDDSFDEISRNLPAMYMQIDGVFSDTRFHSAHHGVVDVRVENEATMNMSVEVLDSRLVPFSVETTSAAVWHFHLIKSKKIPSAIEEQLEESDNLIRRTFVAMLDIPNHRGTARGRMETRRFVEHDRVVILQYAVFDNTERIWGYAPEGYGMRQFLWTVIGPPRDEKLQLSGRAVCQVETFEVMLPYIENPHPSRDVKHDQEMLKLFVLESTKAIKQIETQAIENILMNLSLSRK